MTVVIYADINPAEFKRAIDQAEQKILEVNRRASERLGKRGLQLLQDLTATWDHKPQFEMVTNFSSNDIEVLLGTDDKIFGYLDRGTSVRYAVMTPDFQAKTTPGSLQSGRGRGGVVIVNRKRPRPGIKARDFSGQVEKILNRESEAIFNQEIKRIK